MNERVPYPKNRRPRGQGKTSAERDALWRKRHPERHAARQRKWTSTNPTQALLAAKRDRYKQRYDITLEEYEKLLAAKDGRCWVCGGLPKTKALAVDHDHVKARKGGVRGSIRGILCWRCNKFLIARWHAESAPLLEAAANYLRGSLAQEILRGSP